jgi:hypothetical protein
VLGGELKRIDHSQHFVEVPERVFGTMRSNVSSLSPTADSSPGAAFGFANEDKAFDPSLSKIDSCRGIDCGAGGAGDLRPA